MEMQNGWNTFEIGTILRPFEGSVTDVANTLPEDRSYSQSNSYSASVADWRIEKPIFHAEHCIDCQFCWIYCPDMSIISRDKKMVSIDYEYCKGCGICVEVCPTTPKALLMFQNNKMKLKHCHSGPKKRKKKQRINNGRNNGIT